MKRQSEMFSESLINCRKSIGEFINRQNVDARSANYGGVMDSNMLYQPGSAASLIKNVLSFLYFGKVSDERKEFLLKRAGLAMKFLIKKQYPDGSIDLLPNNFQSAADTAFLLDSMVTSYLILKDMEPCRKIADIMGLLEKFIKKSRHCLIYGKPHTNNHRWVISGIASWINTIFPDKRLVKRVKEYLGEGIDIDPDGIYSERSMIYTGASNFYLLKVAKYLPDPRLYVKIGKSLNFLLYNVRDDRTGVADISWRQDRGSRDINIMRLNAIPFLEMAIKEKNGLYASMWDLLVGISTPDLSVFALYGEELQKLEKAERKPLPDGYARYFADNSLFRIRRKRFDCAIMGKNLSRIMTVQNGNAHIDCFKLLMTYFGLQPFQPRKVDYANGKVVMVQDFTEKNYYPGAPLTRIHNEIGRLKKESLFEKYSLKFPMNLSAKIVFREIRNGVRADWEISGMKGACFQFQINLPDAGFLLQGTKKMTLRQPAVIPFEDDCAVLCVGKDKLKIKGGFFRHNYIAVDSSDFQGVNSPKCSRLVSTGFCPGKGSFYFLTK